MLSLLAAFLLIIVHASALAQTVAANFSCAPELAINEVIAAKPPSVRVVLLFQTGAPVPDPNAVVQRLAAQAGMPVSVASTAQSSPKASDASSTVRTYFERDTNKFFVPTRQFLSFKGRGLSDPEQAKVATSKSALFLSFALNGKGGRSDFVKANSLIGALAKETSAFIFDEGTREVFSGRTWVETRTGESADLISANNHITIHAYREKDYFRAVTLGMSKFGLPEVAVPEFGPEETGSVGHLINAVAQRLVDAPLAAQVGLATISLDTMKPTQWKKSFQGNSPAAMRGEIRICLREAKPHEGDADNRLLNIGFDLESGPDRHAKRFAFLRRAFGVGESDVRMARSGDDELLAASKRAKEKIPKLKADFMAGLGPRERLSVKAAFRTDRGGIEYMWVQIASWSSGGDLRGLLMNQPRDIVALRAGQEVTVKESDFYDYLRTFADGRAEGNETGKVLELRAKTTAR